MKELHEDRALFGQLILETARAQGIEALYVEKDYWITRSLSQLARSAYSENLVFKGGSSLSKAYGLTHRFSEDIDVAVVHADALSQGQLKRLIHHAAHAMSEGLEEVEGDPITRKTSAYYKQLYKFPSSSKGSGALPIREGQILLEINSFANPYPYLRVKIESFIGAFLRERKATEVMDAYGLQPFELGRECHAYLIDQLRYEVRVVLKGVADEVQTLRPQTCAVVVIVRGAVELTPDGIADRLVAD